jgi:hypothetical protein
VVKPVGERWALYEGDDLLGTLTRRDTDMPWFICDFSPTDVFERQYRSRFDESLRLMDSADTREEWDVYEKFYTGLVEHLRLEAEPQAAKVTDFLLHIEGSEARFRAMFEDM